MTAEHKEKIGAALRAYAARPDSHLHGLHKSGAEHPNWKGGVAPHSYQRIAYTTHGTRCLNCGSTQHVDVHHRDGDHGNSDPANLLPLCRSCHNREHGKGGANFKGGVASDYYRSVAFAAHGAMCSSCGATAGLVVRHLDGNKYNSVPANLAVFCRACNYRLHGVGKWCGQPKGAR